MQKKALIYADKGTAPHSVNLTIKALNDIGIAANPILAQDVIEKKWEKDTALFIMPGGRDVFFHTFLSGPGNSKIKNFVHNGGSYLGLCAGAYYACDNIEFEKNTPLEIIGKRELGFFPNKAIGPALGIGQFQYSSEIGAQAALINYSSSNINTSAYIYYNGGCTFENTHTAPSAKIIAHYHHKKKHPAILQINVGKGRAILSSVHIEYSHTHFDPSNIYLKNIIPFFKKTDKEREKIFSDIISNLL
jgi:biotin--protein ligase